MQVVLTKHFQDTREGQNGPYTRHDFKTDDGMKFSTTKAAIAKKAAQFLNQPVTVVYTTKQNGQYTNHYLEDVIPANGAAPTPAPVAQQSEKDAYWERREANDEQRQRTVSAQWAINAALKGIELGVIEGVQSTDDIKLAAQVFLQMSQELVGTKTPVAASPPSAPAEPAGLTPVGSQGDTSGIPY